MIRSAESAEAKWRTVPTGFRVAWQDIDANQPKNGGWTNSSSRNSIGISLITDFLRITTIALYWHVRDYLSQPTQKREVVLRISHT
jgi:hypothetical protein